MALCVASIAAIEIPRGEWAELTGVLIQTAGDSNLNNRLSSLQTLGFMADEIESKHFSEQQKSQVITAIMQNLAAEGQDPRTALIALKAFYSALHLATQNMQNQSERDFIVETVCKIAYVDDEEVQEISMQILVDLCKTFYEQIEYFYQSLCRVTGDFAKSDEEKVSA